ncbi:MAG TPA: 50S ribosomal protein L24 [Candidatus Thermoplasmatota archaeon]|nr:50S ribosomal protein L24 [Candidatus Thermoplasmatota archaeon]
MTSSQPRKQRLRLHNLPHHERPRQLRAHLAEELFLKYGKRSATIRVGDTVKVLRGGHAGTVGKILAVNPSRRTVTVEGVTAAKADGTQKPKPMFASNLLLTKLDLTDRQRRDLLGAQLSADEVKALEREKEEREKAKEAARRAKEEQAEAPEETEADEDEADKEPAAGSGPSEMEEEHAEDDEEEGRK